MPDLGLAPPEPRHDDCQFWCNLARELGKCRAICQQLRWELVDASGTVASMGMTSTRTHTVYWDEDSVAPLLAEIAKLREDFEHRQRYVGAEAAAAMNGRLVLLEQAASLLTDRAD